MAARLERKELQGWQQDFMSRNCRDVSKIGGVKVAVMAARLEGDSGWGLRQWYVVQGQG